MIFDPFDACVEQKQQALILYIAAPSGDLISVITKCNKRFKRPVYVDDSQHKVELLYYKEEKVADDGKHITTAVVDLFK